METINKSRHDFSQFRLAKYLFIALLIVQVALSQSNNESISITGSNIITPIFSTFATVFLFAAAYQTSKNSTRISLAWYAFATSTLFNALGDILWSLLELSGDSIPYPSIADFFFLAAYSFFLIGALLFPQKKGSLLETVKSVLDTSMIFLASLLGTWTLIVSPQLAGNLHSLGWTEIISLVYPIGDVLMLWALVLLIYSEAEGQDRHPLLLMAYGAFVYIIVDFIFAFQYLRDRYISGGLVDIGWPIGYLLFILAAIYQIQWVNQSDEVKPPVSYLLFRVLKIVEQGAPFYTFLFAFIPVAIVLGKPNRHLLFAPFSVTFWIGGLVTLVFIRQALSIYENLTLNKKLNFALALVQDKSNALEQINVDLQREITEHQDAKKQLVYKALHDSLTGLPNRACLLERLTDMLNFSQHYPGAQHAVLYLDCDHFKIVNDSQGHIIGDQLLIQIASRLESCLGSNDVAGRIGGDEFVILLCENINEANITRVANCILDMFSRPFILANGKKVGVSLSIGIVDRLENYSEPEAILRDADIAMYYAKSSGRNRYEFYQQGMRERIELKLEFEHDLLNALERNEFELNYQPIFSLKDMKVASFEALIRWRHPKKGYVSPMDFIPVCEETGLIHKIGGWVLREASSQVMKWRAENPAYRNIHININVSGNQLRHPQFIQQLTQIIEKKGVDPEALHLEITESVFIKNSNKVIQTFWKLRDIGIECEIDDFGSGYSSLKYLQNFQIRNIKIDRSFVRTIQPGQVSEMMRAILAMAQNLDARLTAEGIENKHQLEELRKMGVHYGQGYLFMKPMDLDTADKFLKELNGRSFTLHESL